LATQIATALKTKLAPEEKARLDTRPTNNSQAYVLYLNGVGREVAGNRSSEDLTAAEQLYMQAAALDPGFGLAWAQASILNTEVGSSGEDPARRAKARAQAEEALRVSPNLGEAHAALGLCLRDERNYDVALKELERALASSSNNAEIYYYIAQVYRRQGRWREAVASFQRARSLDPLNDNTAFPAGNNYLFMRDWPAAAASFNRALEISPGRVLPRVGLAYLEVFRNGDPAAGSRTLQGIPAGKDPSGLVSSGRWDMAMLERNYATADKILTETALEEFPQAGDVPKAFYRAVSPSLALTSNRRNAILPRPGQPWKSGCATRQTMHNITQNSPYSTPTCRGRRRQFEKLVARSKSNPKARTHFMALLGRPIWRWCLHSLANMIRRLHSSSVS